MRGGDPCSEISLRDGHGSSGIRHVGGAKAQSGSGTERENLDGDAKGKSTSGSNREAEIPMRRLEADCSVVAGKRGNARGAKGAGHRH